MGIVACLNIGHSHRLHGVLALAEVEGGMVNLKHVVNIIERILKAVRCLGGLSEIELALANHLCNIVKASKIVITGFSQFFIEGVNRAQCHVVALHITEQAEIVLTRIDVALEITLIVKRPGIDICQLVIEIQRQAVFPSVVIGDGAIENAPHLR